MISFYYTSIEGIKKPYEVYTAHDVLVMSMNDTERELVREIMDHIYDSAINEATLYRWPYDRKKYYNKVTVEKILSFFKDLGYTVFHTTTAFGSEFYIFDWCSQRDLC